MPRQIVLNCWQKGDQTALPLVTGDFRKNLGYTGAQSIPEDLDANRKEDEGGEPH